MQIIFLILGFYILIKGADIFVEGAASVSRKIGIPSIIVGLTIISIGTSAPELAVSITSALKGSNDMAIGNVLGSNLFNILVVLGAISLVSPVLIRKKDMLRDYTVTIVSTICLIFLTFFFTVNGEINTVSRIEGVILTIACISYITILVISSIKANKNSLQEISDEEVQEKRNINVPVNIFKILIGIVGIIVGGNMAVDAASNLAASFGMSDKLVGLTIVAIGTSLPELITSLVAARKGENEIALGNILGSCIFNVLLIVGISSSINPLVASSILLIDFLILLFILIVLGIIIFINKKKDVYFTKLMGISFIFTYIIYTIYIIIRN